MCFYIHSRRCGINSSLSVLFICVVVYCGANVNGKWINENVCAKLKLLLCPQFEISMILFLLHGYEWSEVIERSLLWPQNPPTLHVHIKFILLMSQISNSVNPYLILFHCRFSLLSEDFWWLEIWNSIFKCKTTLWGNFGKFYELFVYCENKLQDTKTRRGINFSIDNEKPIKICLNIHKSCGKLDFEFIWMARISFLLVSEKERTRNFYFIEKIS